MRLGELPLLQQNVSLKKNDRMLHTFPACGGGMHGLQQLLRRNTLPLLKYRTGAEILRRGILRGISQRGTWFAIAQV
jgi:hypothetical protein